MPLNKATKENLQRKSAYVDKVQYFQGRPLFSWVDLSLTELCNRSAGAPNACPFCPRYDRKFYPNQNLHMTIALADQIGFELRQIGYKGTVVLCGYGEPLLHPQIEDVVGKLHGLRVEVVTNGDTLGPEKITKLVEAGVDFFVVSMYDGPHQVDKFKRNFLEAEIGPDMFLLRDRWHTEADAFGLKLTNRAGTVHVGQQDKVDTNKPCHYLAYQLTIDWNGDVLLCPQDWHKRLKFGNVGTERLVDIWFSKRMNKRRMQLIAGRRSEHPCSGCNTDGTLHGMNHVPGWTAPEHVLYETGDPGAPDVIKDRNGEVVLGLCKRCGRGEIQLDEPCVIREVG